MKFSIIRTELLKGLGAIYPILERKKGAGIAILEHILVKVDPGTQTASLTSTNGDIMVTKIIPVVKTSEEAIGFTIIGSTFYEIIRRLEEEFEVFFEIASAQKDFIQIKSSNCVFTLATLSATSFPLISHSDITDHFQILGSHLLMLLKRTQYAVSSDEVRMHLNGIHLHSKESSVIGRQIERQREVAGYRHSDQDSQKFLEIGDDHESRDLNPVVVAVATDTHRLAVAEVQMTKIADREKNPNNVATAASQNLKITIPRKTVSELISVIENEKSEDSILEIGLSKRKLYLKAENTILCSKLIDLQFPNYQAAIHDIDYYFEFSKKQLIYAINLVTTISESRLRIVELLISGDNCCVLVENQIATKTSAKQDISVRTNCAEQVKLIVNGKYLIDMISGLTTENVVIGTSKDLSFLQVCDLVNGSSLNVLMPIKAPSQ